MKIQLITKRNNIRNGVQLTIKHDAFECPNSSVSQMIRRNCKR